jgi:hypothetical protein
MKNLTTNTTFPKEITSMSLEEAILFFADRLENEDNEIDRAIANDLRFLVKLTSENK